ncbi:MAG: histidine--tRNA ligase [Candidatus Bathyarchaeota archaeon]|nr:MAG: histidine--tRNA ligase [Candidatus Bathyarchaeota archaeon]
MSVFRPVRGMRDFLPKEAELMEYIEDKARTVAQLYGYREIMTPVLEPYELLAAKSGEEIRSRMYAFKDLGGRKVALRYEFTASVARLVADTFRTEPKPLRLFCVGSLYRYDEPQHGRFREFWQSNYELMGSSTPEADAEIILLTNSLMRDVGLKNFVFKIGHVGVLRSILSEEGIEEEAQNRAMHFMDKKEYENAFTLIKGAGASEGCLETLTGLVKIKGEKTFEVSRRMEEQVEAYEKATEAVGRLRKIIELVLETGEKIDIRVEAGFARGLEYYTGIIFEVYVPDMEIALAGGGRYDKLIELFGGEPTPAVGVAHGLDRIMLAMEEQKTALKRKEKIMVAVIPIEDHLKGEALKISQMLRGADVTARVEVMGRKLANALQDAARRKTDYAVILGERELKDGSVVVRDFKRRTQKTIKIEEIVEEIKT